MVDRDLVFEKIKNIQNCLKRIRDVTQFNPNSLDDLNIQDIFVLNLQRAVQSTIDLAAHVVASEGLGVPEKLKENFTLLEKAKIISPECTKKMMLMVGFRNIAVHEYQEIDIEILKSILIQHVADIEKFYIDILQFYGLDK